MVLQLLLGDRETDLRRFCLTVDLGDLEPGEAAWKSQSSCRRS